MDPTTVVCPNLACPARGHIDQGNMDIHARKDQRCICTQCRTPCAATQGTACDRLRTPAETVALVRMLLAHGCPLHALVVACGCVPEEPDRCRVVGTLRATGGYRDTTLILIIPTRGR